MIHYSIRKVDTVTRLLHLVGLIRQRAFFEESENHVTTELQQPGGVSSQFSDPLHYQICLLYYVDT